MFIVIGGIPLRHLVYRVLDLPQSMRPFVYDFGQLNTSTEYSYTFQVVANHVREYRCLKKTLWLLNFLLQINRHRSLRLSSVQSTMVRAIANVLAWSQDYMRRRQVYTAYFNSYTPSYA